MVATNVNITLIQSFRGSILFMLLIFAEMNKTALFFLIIFSGFITAPTVVTYFNSSADVSMAFTANEEENCVKNHIVLEFIFQDNDKQDLGKQFLLQKSSIEHYHLLAEKMILLEVFSPPPQVT